MALFIRADHSQDFVQSAGRGGFSPLCCSLPAGRCRTDGIDRLTWGCRRPAAFAVTSSTLLNAPFCDARHFCTWNNPGIFQSPPVCGRYGRHVRRSELATNDSQPEVFLVSTAGELI